jgi:hypothetical protein
MQQFLGALGTEIEITDHESYKWEMREVLAAARQNIEYLQGKGFLRTTSGNPINGKVIMSTRNVRTTGLKAVSA